MRWRACLALAFLGDPAALAPLHKLIENEPARIVVEQAERAVARLEGTGKPALCGAKEFRTASRWRTGR